MALQSGGYQRQASGLARVTQGAVEFVAGRQESPSEALSDLRLPPDAFKVLAPLLQELHFKLDNDASVTFYGSERKFAVVESGSESRALLHLAGWVLDNPSAAKSDALSALPHVFRKFAGIFMLSQGVDVIPAPAYEEMITLDWKRDFGAAVEWVPWMRIRGLERPGLPKDQVHDTLRYVFKLQAEPVTVDLYGRPFLSALRRMLVDRLEEHELQALCYDIEGDYESLSGSGKAAKALSLVEYARSRGLVEKLIEMGKLQRPDISWEEMGS